MLPGLTIPATQKEFLYRALRDCLNDTNKFVRAWSYQGLKEHYLFYYLVDNELTNAQLREGQLYRCLAPDTIRAGYVDQKPIVPSHLEILNWFWAHRNA